MLSSFKYFYFGIVPNIVDYLGWLSMMSSLEEIVYYLGWLSLMSTLEEIPVAQRFG
jgi:hypothetical protein